MKVKWLAVALMIGASVALGGMKIHVNGLSDDTINIEDEDAVILSVELTDAVPCKSYTLNLSISDPHNGLFDYTETTFPVLYDFPGKVVTENSSSKKVQVTATQWLSAAPTEGLLVDNLILMFNSGSPIQVTLTAVADDTVLNGQALTADTIMDSIWVVPHASGDTHSLTCMVVGDHGVVVPDSGRYSTNEVVALTAVPDTGYRVAGWSGADNSWLLESNTITMTKDRTVKVKFEAIPEDLVTKAIFKADKKRDGEVISDSFIISGQLSAGQDILTTADSFSVALNGPDEVFSQAVPFDDEGFKMNSKETGFYFKGTDGLKLVKVDVAKGVFTLYGRNIDLSGLTSPVTLAFAIGDFDVMYELDESILNGAKTMPVEYLLGNTDYLQVRKQVVKTNSKTGLSSAKIYGSFALDETLSSDEQQDLQVTVSWGDFTETIPVGEDGFKFTKGKYVYKRPKELAETYFINYAYFDTSKGIFYITISDTTLQTEVPVVFSLQIDINAVTALNQSITIESL